MSINLINYALAKKDWEKAYEDLKVLGSGERNWFARSKMPDDYEYIVPGVYGFEYQLEPNTTYTASITEGTGLAPIYFYVPGKEVPNQYVTGVRPNRPRTITTDESGLVVVAWSYGGGFSFDILKNGEKNLMITKGDKAADWTPAPEDINAHPFVAELAEAVYRSKQNEERIRNLENAITALGGGS